MRSPTPSITATALLAILSPSAFSQAENGIWHISGIEAPSDLKEAYWDGESPTNRIGNASYDYAHPGETLVDTYFASPTSITSANITLNNGIISGDFSGSYSVGNNGKVSIIADGDAVTGYVNTAADTMVISTADPDNVGVNVLTRLPASLTTAALAGAWRFIVIDLPDDLTEAYWDGISPNPRNNKASDPFNGYAQEGETLVDTYFEDNPQQQILNMQIDSAGNITGDAGNGTASVNPNKSVTINLGGNLNVFYPNAAADVMTLAREDLPVYTKIIAVRLPAAPPALADIQGLWRGQWLDFPTYLTEHYYNVDTDQSRDSTGPNDFAQEGELLVDTYFMNPPQLGTDILSISATGVVSGSASGQISVSGNGYSFTPTGGGTPIILYPNASRNVITAADSTANNLNLSTLIKVAEAPAESFDSLVNLQTTFSGNSMGITWEPSTEFQLMQADSLEGPWEVVPGTSGSSSFVIDTSLATKAFFRIQQVEE